MELTEYQKGIRDLQNSLRKYGAVLLGIDGMSEEYHKFLAKNNIKLRRPTKSQRAVQRELVVYGYPPTKTTTTTATSQAKTYKGLI
ncbi:hypothetical protein LCGC14_3017280 [marine sediment metagenome]|uniref:Uncharacterized protein n=1 Tax=marine sediment metagenome TaxID=412755 RepID=A0A0F8WWU1_9ZZZZ